MKLDLLLAAGCIASAVLLAVAYVPLKHALAQWANLGAYGAAATLIAIIALQVTCGTRLLSSRRQRDGRPGR
jgi:hypothetical protein